MVLNNPPRETGNQDGGPCYRCVFPKPPPPDSVVSCADGGILGPVVGTMGVLQALEAIKVITAPSNNVVRNTSSVRDSPSLLIFSAYSNPQFRTIKLRSRRPNCAVCSANATISIDTITSGSTDYVFFCGSASPTSILHPNERISPQDYHARHMPCLPSTGSDVPIEPRPHTLIDVRDKAQFGICSLENSINIPISSILASVPRPGVQTSQDDEASHIGGFPPWLPPDLASAERNDPIYVVCRLGNDSQLAVQKLKALGLDRNGQRFIGDIRGGFHAWREQVDPQWPQY